MQSRTETQILLEMIQDANNKGLIQASQETIEEIKQGIFTSNQYILDLAVHSKILSELEKENETNWNNININTATGQAIDNLGNLVNVPRIPASPAFVDINISIPVPSGENITIPSGTKVLIETAANIGEYITSDEIILPAGMESVTGRAESVDYGFQNNVLIGNVNGLDGFPTLTVTNEQEGTHGRNIEEDDDYRERVKNWSSALNIGTRACIDNYLGMYDGLDSYRLVPRYDGVGTLKIVCDTLPTLLEQISNDVYENCMLVTDFPPLCVIPESTTLATLELTITKGEGLNIYTDDELEQLVAAQAETFINGGLKRNSTRYKGMGIGEDFIPSQIVQYLMGEFPELINIVPDSMETVSVPDENHFNIEEINVVIT